MALSSHEWACARGFASVRVSVHAHTHPHTLPPVLLTGIGAVTISGENTSAINSRFCEDYTLNNYH